ncbi:putative uncharacterized protein [Clostridium sp. CAG:448]|nr:putative uncharacterized protein [Clostridium sp. CAG:448]
MPEMLYGTLSVLIVSSAERLNATMLSSLPESRYQPITAVPDASAASRMLLERPFDLVIVNTPLPDQFGTRFALDVCEKTAAGVLLLVKAEHYADIDARVSPYGVLTLSKPTSAGLFSQSLQLLAATHARLRRMEQKTASMEEKMEEIRMVNRAKWLLIEQFKMTEQQAHRYIEKQAMDRCITRRAVAEQILATYR